MKNSFQFRNNRHVHKNNYGQTLINLCYPKVLETLSINLCFVERWERERANKFFTNTGAIEGLLYIVCVNKIQWIKRVEDKSWSRGNAKSWDFTRKSTVNKNKGNDFWHEICRKQWKIPRNTDCKIKQEARNVQKHAILAFIHRKHSIKWWQLLVINSKYWQFPVVLEPLTFPLKWMFTFIGLYVRIMLFTHCFNQIKPKSNTTFPIKLSESLLWDERNLYLLSTLRYYPFNVISPAFCYFSTAHQTNLYAATQNIIKIRPKNKLRLYDVVDVVCHFSGITTN